MAPTASDTSVPPIASPPWPAVVGLTAALWSAVGLLVVWLGAVVGYEFVRPLPTARVGGLVERACNFDGTWYAQIARDGYAPGEFSAFPATPLLAAAIAGSTGCTTEMALLVVANVSAAAVVFCLAYCAAGSGNGQAYEGVAAAAALAPATVCFHDARSEALCAALIAVVLLGFRRRWNVFAMAFAVGAATAARPVGVALLPALAWYAWRTAAVAHDARPAQALGARIVRAAGACVVGLWGLAAFMVYQRLAFGDAFLFVDAQTACHLRIGSEDATFGDRLWRLVVLEPIWANYVPSSDAYWARYEDVPFWLSLRFANPLYFVATCGLVYLGRKKRWLSREEVWAGVGLLAIPYILRSYDNGMAGFMRFSGVVLPAYLVLGNALTHSPTWLRVVLALASAGLLGMYAALVIAGYKIY